MDIIILATIAGVILYKLYMELGTEDDNAKKKHLAKIISINGSKQEMEQEEEENSEEKDLIANIVLIDSQPKNHVKIIQKKDNNFSLENFAIGALKSFELIQGAYNDQDMEVLKMLLTPSMYNSFMLNIKDKIHIGTLVKILKLHIKNIDSSDNKVRINVEFLSEQIFDEELNTENVQDKIEKVIDKWIFECSSVQKNVWKLSAIKN